MSNENKRFATASNARRAARTDGLTLDQIAVKQDGAKFFYLKINEDNAEETEIEVQADVTHYNLIMVGADGSEYGPVALIEAEKTATMLAELEKMAITVKDRDSDFVFLTAEFHAEAVADTVEVVELQDLVEETAETDQVTVEGVDMTENEPTEVTTESQVEISRPVLLTVQLDSRQAAEIADKLVKLTGVTVQIAELLDLTVLNTIQPKVKSIKTERVVTEGKRARKEAPEGKTAEVIRLCRREEGASPAELIKATGWEKAPWKWNLSNPKGTGWAQRYGYDLIATRDGREVRYLLVEKMDETSEAA